MYQTLPIAIGAAAPCTVCSPMPAVCPLGGAVLPADGAASLIQGEKVWTFFGGRVG